MTSLLTFVVLEIVNCLFLSDHGKHNFEKVIAKFNLTLCFQPMGLDVVKYITHICFLVVIASSLLIHHSKWPWLRWNWINEKVLQEIKLIWAKSQAENQSSLSIYWPCRPCKCAILNLLPELAEVCFYQYGARVGKCSALYLVFWWK